MGLTSSRPVSAVQALDAANVAAHTSANSAHAAVSNTAAPTNHAATNTPLVAAAVANGEDWPAFTADGQTVLYTLTSGTAQSLQATPVNSDNPTAFTNMAAPQSRAAISWTWPYVALTSTVNGASTLWTTDYQGANAKQYVCAGLYNNVVTGGWYTQSANPTLVVVDSGVAKSVDINGCNVTALTDPSTITVVEVDVSPADNSLLVLSARTAGSNDPYSIWLVNGSDAPSQFDTLQGRSPRFSPDGSRFLFESTRGGGGTSRIYMANMSTETVTPVTAAELDAHHPAWSPDGHTIAFSVNMGGNNKVYYMHI